MVRRLGENYYSIHDIFQEEKLQVFQDLLRPNREEAAELIAHNFEETRPLLKAMATEGLPMPRLYRRPGRNHPEPAPGETPASDGAEPYLHLHLRGDHGGDRRCPTHGVEAGNP